MSHQQLGNGVEKDCYDEIFSVLLHLIYLEMHIKIHINQQPTISLDILLFILSLLAVSLDWSCSSDHPKASTDRSDSRTGCWYFPFSYKKIN